MSPDQRIQKIEEFIHTQRYLHGGRFRVVALDDDRFRVEIEACTERQLASLNHNLRSNLMSHIVAVALTITKPTSHDKKRN